MAVGDFQREMQRVTTSAGMTLENGWRFPWLSGLGHAEPEAQSAPSPVLERLFELHDELGGEATKLLRKGRQQATVDFTMPGHIIVELDEFQHFSTARLRSLGFYDGLDHSLNIDRYRSLCIRHMARADSYRTQKQAVDFPFRGGRTAQRAYLDACRDLLGPTFGYRDIRVAAPEGNVSSALLELRHGLAN